MLVADVKYLTTISFFMVLLSSYIYKYINLLFLTIFVCLGGLYVSYTTMTYENMSSIQNLFVGPKEYTIYKFFLDVFFHILPLVYIYFNYRNYYKLNPASETAIILIIVYLCAIKIENLYALNDETNVHVIGSIFVIMIVIYLIFFKK